MYKILLHYRQYGSTWPLCVEFDIIPISDTAPNQKAEDAKQCFQSSQDQFVFVTLSLSVFPQF